MGVRMFEVIVAAALPLLSKLLQMLIEAPKASKERSEEILAQLRAAESALSKTAADAHASVEAEAKTTRDAIAVRTEPKP